MINKYRGETVDFITVIKDANGSALNSETPTFSLEDATGSTIFTGNGTFQSAGSYLMRTNVGANWGTGPVRYWWTVAGANGTEQDFRTNELFIVAGTSETLGYVYEAELIDYYSRIDDYVDDHTQARITANYHVINRKLESLNIKAPRARKADGLFDQSLRDWNAWLAIRDMVADREVNRVDPNDEPWYNSFGSNAMSIYDAIKTKKIVFSDQVSSADAGIGIPSRTAGSSIGTMFNNWDRSWGKGFQGSDFKRKWIVEVIGTGTNGELGECLASWSRDGGLTVGTITTAYTWIHLVDEVWVRFDRGTATGTADIMAIGDKWEFTTEPLKAAVGGVRTVKSY